MTSFLNERARDGVAITPDDGTDLTNDVGGLYIGVTGNVRVVTAQGTTLTFVGLQAGSVLALDIRRVHATATTATNLIGLTL